MAGRRVRRGGANAALVCCLHPIPQPTRQRLTAGIVHVAARAAGSAARAARRLLDLRLHTPALGGAARCTRVAGASGWGPRALQQHAAAPLPLPLAGRPQRRQDAWARPLTAGARHGGGSNTSGWAAPLVPLRTQGNGVSGWDAAVRLVGLGRASGCAAPGTQEKGAPGITHRTPAPAPAAPIPVTMDADRLCTSPFVAGEVRIRLRPPRCGPFRGRPPRRPSPLDRSPAPRPLRPPPPPSAGRTARRHPAALQRAGRQRGTPDPGGAPHAVRRPARPPHTRCPTPRPVARRPPAK